MASVLHPRNGCISLGWGREGVKCLDSFGMKASLENRVISLADHQDTCVSAAIFSIKINRQVSISFSGAPGQWGPHHMVASVLCTRGKMRLELGAVGPNELIQMGTKLTASSNFEVSIS